MNKILHQITRFHKQGVFPNVAIFSSARSGSSWLMELVATQAGFKFVDEPLHPANLVKCDIFSATRDELWNYLLPHDQRNGLLKDYFRAIENNQTHIGEPRLFSEFYRMFTDRIVFKILRSKDLIDWYEEHFGWQIVYLIRHPLAANLSRKQFPRLKLFLQNEEYCNSYLKSEQVDFSREILRRGTDLQRGVLDWCLQNVPVLQKKHSRNWSTVFYEDLVVHPEEEIARLTDHLKLDDPSAIHRRMSRASGSTVQSDAKTRDAFASSPGRLTPEFLLGKWRDKLSTVEESLAFEVLDCFSIDLYRPGSNLPVKPHEALPPNPSSVSYGADG